jgi:hypothetical protein
MKPCSTREQEGGPCVVVGNKIKEEIKEAISGKSVENRHRKPKGEMIRGTLTRQRK